MCAFIPNQPRNLCKIRSVITQMRHEMNDRINSGKKRGEHTSIENIDRDWNGRRVSES
jgi:hypothetical protein